MPLVEYSDSDDEKDEGDARPQIGAEADAKRRGVKSTAKEVPPPPPASFFNLYTTAARASTTDDPSLHGGRKRVTPHVEGNWPTHVYLEWYPNQQEADVLTTLLTNLDLHPQQSKAASQEVEVLHSLIQSELGVPLPLHISLSRSIQLQGHQREAFQTQLASRLQASHVEVFEVSFTSLKWVANYEGTRWFLVLGVTCSDNQLNRLLHACNQACSTFGLPQLYMGDKEAASPATSAPDRSEAFHFSLAWCLSKGDLQIQGPETDMDGHSDKSISHLQPSFDAAKLKMGNVVVDIPLKGRS